MSIGDNVSSLLNDATATLNELLRMHELNQELLETLVVTMAWVRDYAKKHNLPLPKETSYNSLINKAQTLVEELSSKSPNPCALCNRRKVTDFRADEEGTEPTEGGYAHTNTCSQPLSPDVESKKGI
jgi:hypothetical protein